MRAPTLMRGPLLATRAAAPAASIGQVVFSKSQRRESGMNRLLPA
jgi:hypothetical protein